VLLHTFSSFNDALLNECSQPILKGLTDCCKGPNALRSELAGSPDFWAILSRLSVVPEAAGDVFAVVEDLTTSIQPGITADNYEAAIALLNEFATAAQVGAREEQLFDQASKRSRGGQKPKKPESNEVVVRGSTAMSIVFQLSGRVPNFIEQSHLETKEGKSLMLANWHGANNVFSMDCLLVPHSQDTHSPVSQSLSRNPPASFLIAPTHSTFRPSGIARPQRMDRHI
jgi:brefeldin A-resistance guanine nucleotide exchange factor 1